MGIYEEKIKEIFISNISVNKVRHLRDISIPLAIDKKKHLMFTGKNGSGKTSLLDALSVFLDSITTTDNPMQAQKFLNMAMENLAFYKGQVNSIQKIREVEQNIKFYEDIIKSSTAGIMLELNCPKECVRPEFEMGKFIVAYYKADRVFKTQVPKHVEKVILKDGYKIEEAPREDFVKYLLDIKMTQALAISNGKIEKANQIKEWFDNLENLLKDIFRDNSLSLEFDEDTFRFSLIMEGREPFDFNTLSSGYAAVLDIVLDLILRMEKQTNKKFDYSVPGIVLIDEIETHLHLELQKRIMELLTNIFPNVQFIVSTHSPFVLNSISDVVIYDLEKNILVKNGLIDVPYNGIVEGYFNADMLSYDLRTKYEQYKRFVEKSELTDDDFEKIADIEMYLDEIPDYLALNITTEYQRLKAELRKREDI